MKIFEEPIHYQNPLLHLKVGEFTETGIQTSHTKPHTDWMWHYHKEVEFLYIRSGTHSIHTRNHCYILNPGDVLVIGSSQLHLGHKISEEDLVYIVLHVDLQPYFDSPMMMYYPYFSEVKSPLESLNDMFRENDRLREEIGEFIIRIYDEIMERKKGYEIAAGIYIRHILLAMLRGDSKGLLQSNNSEDVNTLNPILEYVEDHLHEKIDMEEISRLANMSYHYFSKFFKKTMGLTFTEYLNRKRIFRAEQLILTTSQTITEIAEAVSIENMAHFYKLFKRYNGCTPKQFSENMQAISE